MGQCSDLTHASEKILSLDVLLVVLAANTSCFNGFDIKIKALLSLDLFTPESACGKDRVSPRKRGIFLAGSRLEISRDITFSFVAVFQ